MPLNRSVFLVGIGACTAAAAAIAPAALAAADSPSSLVKTGSFLGQMKGTTITVKGVFGGNAARPHITGTVTAVDRTGSTTCRTAGPAHVSSFIDNWDTPNPGVA
jgi:hypothetical protein